MTVDPLPERQREYLDAIGGGFLEGGREGVYIFDEEGSRYLDGVSGAGIYNLGRRPPELAEALRAAMKETDQGNFPMISEEKAALGQALAEFIPGALECSIFSVTRGEAMDAACKIARGATGRSRLIALESAYHGETGFAESLSSHEAGLIPDIRHIAPGDTEAAEQKIDSAAAAVIVEAVQAENGCRCIDAEYLRHLEKLCRRHEALLIVDETQTGFGRCGRPFAYDESGVQPDMLVLGEALGGGMFPIAATLMTQQVNTFLNAHPLIHLSTFGGSDIGCRVAIEAIRIYEASALHEKAAAAGALLRKGLEDIAARAEGIHHISGRGLLLALHLATAEKARKFCRAASENGLLLLPGRVAENTVIIRPPLNITEAETGELLNAAESAAEAL
jgi:putrescine aminotransferase